MPKAHHATSGGSALGQSQKVPIAGVRHPTGASEMAIVDASTAFGVVCGIESEQDLHRLCPIGAIGIRVQQARVEFDVRLVIGGEFLSCWRGICECLDHDAGSITMRRLHLNHVLSKMERRQAWASFARRSARCGGWIGLISAIIDQQHSLPFVGGQEDDAGSFQDRKSVV